MRGSVGYKLSVRAEDDLAQLYADGLLLFGDAQAGAYLDDLFSTLDFLACYPRAARVRSEIAPPVRVHPYKAHLIIYETDGDEVRVLRVRHSRENWGAGL